MLVGAGLAALVGLVAWKLGAGRLASYAIGVNVATFALYDWDKWAAKGQRTRIPELVLHIFALIGGSPGALAGQIVFNHKTSDRKFQLVFVAIVVVQVVVVVWSW
jgi:uncharacterized membrane protein YsdA (DUF1294 family)